MRDMLTVNATDVRRDWSLVIDDVVRKRPKFIKRTRDYMILSDLNLFENILVVYKFTAQSFIEDDGSITLSLNEIDLIENASTETEAKLALAQAILQYAQDYYNEFQLWSTAPNRKNHIPYVLKALIIDDAHKIGDSIQCQRGKN
jgi:hypothetical protein